MEALQTTKEPQVMHLAERPVPILMYHSISHGATPQFKVNTVSPERFAQQMAYLREVDYTTITVTQYADALQNGGYRLPAHLVVLTFDDGYEDFFSAALPILTQYDLTGTLYISTGYVGYTSRWLHREGESQRLMLTWKQIVEIQHAGIECGAHTCSHSQLDALPAEIARDEIVGSKIALEEKLNHPIVSFAYPYGFYTDTIQNMVKAAGFSSACAVKLAMSSTADDRFALSRLQITNDTTLERFASLVGGLGQSVSPRSETITRKVRNMIRRNAVRLQYYLQPESHYRVDE